MEMVDEKRTPVADWYRTEFAALKRSLNGMASGELGRRRDAAFEQFCALGFPTPHDELWKYTNVAEIARSSYRLGASCPVPVVPAEDLRSVRISGGQVSELVFVNGRYSPELSSSALPAGVEFSPLPAVLDGSSRYAHELRPLADQYLCRLASAEDHSFVALNTAFFSDAAILRIRRGADVAGLLHLIFVSVPGETIATQPRVLVVSEPESRATVVESYLGLEGPAAFTAAVTEAIVEDGATLEHVKIQDESNAGQHVGVLQIRAQRNSRTISHVFHLGGRLVRNEVRPVLDGEGIECEMHGLTTIGGEQHVDNSTVIDHTKPNCFSREDYKGIYAGKSTGVFVGTIIVRPQAQKTNAVQSNQNVLLSRDAAVNTKPQLKIWANDVKCTHGATVGELDEEAVFYLRSRGINRDTARRMLIHAFASDVVDRVRSPILGAHLTQLLNARLESY